MVFGISGSTSFAHLSGIGLATSSIGTADSLEKLADLAITHQDAVSALHDLARGGHEAAREALKALPIKHHADHSFTDPFAVYALSHLAEAGNEAASGWLRSFEVFDYSREAQDHPIAVSVLGRFDRAGNEAAHYLLERFDIRPYVQQAATNPEAMEALSHPAAAGNAAAADALFDLAENGHQDAIPALAAAAERNPYCIFALNHLAEGGHEGAKLSLSKLDVTPLVPLIAANDPGAIKTIGYLVKAGNPAAGPSYIHSAGANPHVLTNPDLDRITRNADLRKTLRGLNFDVPAYVRALNSEDPKTGNLLTRLVELAQQGNESAVEIIADAARSNLWALWNLDRLKGTNIAVRNLMKKLDVAAYAEVAKTRPYVVFGLCFLAREGNSGARDLMKNLDVTALISMATSAQGEFQQAFYALRELAIAGSSTAFWALTELATNHARAREQLSVIAKESILI